MDSESNIFMLWNLNELYHVKYVSFFLFKIKPNSIPSIISSMQVHTFNNISSINNRGIKNKNYSN